MSVQHPYFIQRENFTESHIALAQEVLECNQEAGFIFTTPEYTINSHQKLRDISVPHQSLLKDWLQEARAQLEKAVVEGYKDVKIMGGLPFCSAADVNLMLMQNAKIYQKVLYAQSDIDFDTLTFRKADYLPSGEHYQQQVEYLVQQMQAKNSIKPYLLVFYKLSLIKRFLSQTCFITWPSIILKDITMQSQGILKAKGGLWVQAPSF